MLKIEISYLNSSKGLRIITPRNAILTTFSMAFPSALCCLLSGLRGHRTSTVASCLIGPCRFSRWAVVGFPFVCIKPETEMETEAETSLQHLRIAIVAVAVAVWWPKSVPWQQQHLDYISVLLPLRGINATHLVGWLRHAALLHQQLFAAVRCPLSAALSLAPRTRLLRLIYAPYTRVYAARSDRKRKLCEVVCSGLIASSDYNVPDTEPKTESLAIETSASILGFLRRITQRLYVYVTLCWQLIKSPLRRNW